MIVEMLHPTTRSSTTPTPRNAVTDVDGDRHSSCAGGRTELQRHQVLDSDRAAPRPADRRLGGTTHGAGGRTPARRAGYLRSTAPARTDDMDAHATAKHTGRVHDRL